jgi:ribosomal protein S12 methylthiotransferase
MELQQQISFELNEPKVGNTYDVLFDRKEGQYFVGRTQFDSPEVDNEVLVDARNHFVRVGDFAKVRITQADAFDLYGDPIH